MRAVAVAWSEDEVATGERPVVSLDRQAPKALPVERERHRAKALRLGELRLGERHAQIVGAQTHYATVESAPCRLSSLVRARGRRGAALLFVELMTVAGVTSAEVAAAIDVVPQRVAQMRSGERAVELGDLLLMVERLESVRAVFAAMLRERLEGPR